MHPTNKETSSPAEQKNKRPNTEECHQEEQDVADQQLADN